MAKVHNGPRGEGRPWLLELGKRELSGRGCHKKNNFLLLRDTQPASCYCKRGNNCLDSILPSSSDLLPGLPTGQTCLETRGNETIDVVYGLVEQAETIWFWPQRG